MKQAEQLGVDKDQVITIKADGNWLSVVASDEFEDVSLMLTYDQAIAFQSKLASVVNTITKTNNQWYHQ
jgi:hypothetical protein